MSRFYSEYEIKKFDKQLNEQELLNASKYRVQLKDAINIENQRINIDSAKKKAVMQGMDYNGFHQMVLGANLKGVKTSELLELKPTTPIMNNVMTRQLMGKEKDVLAGNFVIDEPDINRDGFEIISKLKIEDGLNHKEQYKIFKKYFKTSKSTEDKILFLLNNKNFQNLINSDLLDSDIFLEFIFHIGSYILSEYKKIEKETINFLIDCLGYIIQHNQFSSLKKFIGKKHKNIYLQLEDVKNDFCKENKFKDIGMILNNIL